MKKLYTIVFAIIITAFGLQAQDYFPLEVGHKWTYEFYDDGVFDEDTIILEIVDFENSNDLNIYEFQQFTEGEFIDSIYFIEKINEPNDIFIAYDQDEIMDENLSIAFKHSYNENDTLKTEEGIFVANYLGDYLTNRGVLYTDCWKLSELADDLTYILAPNVGIIAFVFDEFISADRYELRIFVNGGTNATSNIEKSLYNITFGPNPVNSILNIKSKEYIQGSQVSIFDQHGKLVITEGFEGQQKIINMSNLPGGIYIISMTENNKIIFSQEVVKI